MKQQGLGFESFEELLHDAGSQAIQAPVQLISGYLNADQQAALFNEVDTYH